MSLIKILLAGLTGTTLMTSYSYLMSRIRKEQFKEPVLLHRLAEEDLKPVTGVPEKKKGRLLGWVLHYAAGMLFSAAYDRIWRRSGIRPSVVSGIIMGTVSGVVGVSIWRVVLKLHHNAPGVDIRDFSRHLMAAHAVYGIFASLGYRLPEGPGMLLSEKAGPETSESAHGMPVYIQ
jgi:hypothetical protein